MPEAITHIPADIRAMLAKATPLQLERLLWDILLSQPVVRSEVRHDA